MNRSVVGFMLVAGLACSAERPGDPMMHSGTGGASASSSGADAGGSSGDVEALDAGVEHTCESLRVAPSSVGCSFVAGMSRDAGVALANMTGQTATVTISDNDGVIEEVEVGPGETEFAIWTGDGPGTGVVGSAIYENLVRFIDSDRPIQAWQFTPPLSGVDNDASVLLPVHALGTRHRVVTYMGASPDPEIAPTFTPFGDPILLVHGVQDDTEVTVSLTSPMARANFSFANPSLPTLDVEAGENTMTVHLSRGQTLLLSDHEEGRDIEPPQADWTGALVDSSAPVAVYTASFTSLPWDEWPDPFGLCCSDTIAAAIPPTSVLGTRYVVAKTMPLSREYDLFRVVANEDGTQITVTGDEALEFTLDEGQFADFRSTGAVVVDGNRPFAMAQYMVSSMIGFPDQGPAQTHDCGQIDSPGDPGLNLLFPTDNWLDEYRFPAGAAGIGGGGWCHNHATVVARVSDWDSVTLGGEALPGVTRIGDSDYGFARVPLEGGKVYELKSADGDGVQLDVYGYRDDGSYIYPGGMRLEPINPEG